ncbi:hypothetical protein E3G52_000316 [Mycobacteroides abscessus]|uniref:hypothetical protein n=1 Tax=Mycobacteroides abscessus TaxID=36809 RepID=UPI001878EDB8|nr:hypothetical protein [Mycobacteroides abscessus]MBE5453452.1 hypothetical protein [Mycobacteroides abscessus]
MEREWTYEQLKRWRIRKADGDENLPWRHTSLFSSSVPQWCVWRPGEQHPVACVDTQQAAMRHIAFQFLRDIEWLHEANAAGAELARINARPRTQQEHA